MTIDKKTVFVVNAELMKAILENTKNPTIQNSVDIHWALMHTKTLEQFETDLVKLEKQTKDGKKKPMKWSNEELKQAAEEMQQ